MSVWLIAAALLMAAPPARAQNASERVFPPGGQRGTTVTLTFPAMEKVESAALVVDGDGLRAVGPFVKGVGKVEIAADAQPGVRQIRLVGPAAATEPRPFAVGVLPEVLEQEPNDLLENAQRIESLPVTLNGAIAKPPDIDDFRVTLKRGDCLVVASESRRLAGPIYLALSVRDSRGRSVPVDEDDRKRDPVFTCAIPADGEYVLQLSDFTGNMGNVDEGCQYRLHLTTGPWLDYSVPASVTRGTTAHLTAYGWNLGGKAGPGSLSLEQAVPPDAPERWSVSAGGAPNTIPLLTGAAPELDEREPNDAPATAQELTLPAVARGLLGKRGDVDAFRFTAKAGQAVQIRVTARELDSRADPEFRVLDSAGKELLRADDPERSRDPVDVWTAPADGTYVLLVRDIAGGSRGGPDSYYRLEVGPVVPTTTIVAASPTLTVKPGAKGEWSLTVYQWYSPEELTVQVEGLPKGVTAEPLKIPASKRPDTRTVKLVLTAAADAPPGFGTVRITARPAEGAGVPVEAAWMLTGDGGVPLGTGAARSLVVLVPVP